MNQAFYLYATNSDVANYLGSANYPFGTYTTLTFSGMASGNTMLTNWITPPGVPGVDSVPAGTYEFHIHGDKSGGTKSVAVYAEIWETDAAGADIAKIGTTETTPVLGGSEVEYRVFFPDGDVYNFASTSSRVDCRMYATVTGAGTAPHLQIFIGGEADSHIAIPGFQGGGGAATITLTGDATGSGSGTIAVTVTNLQQAIVTNHVYWTNVVALTNSQFQTVDMEIKEGDFQTNTSFAFLGITHKSTTNYQSAVITVTNSTGTAIAILAPPNTHTNGTLPYNCTNVSKVLVELQPKATITPTCFVLPCFSDETPDLHRCCPDRATRRGPGRAVHIQRPADIPLWGAHALPTSIPMTTWRATAWRRT